MGRTAMAVLALMALVLAACRPAAEPADAAATPEPAPQDAGIDAAVPPAAAAPPAGLAGPSGLAEDPGEEFAGWYLEREGAALLQACGQPVPLKVADPAFLRDLHAKLGGGTAPVYVRLAVRPAGGAQLAVTQVRQFGVDEGPAPDCLFVAGN